MIKSNCFIISTASIILLIAIIISSSTAVPLTNSTILISQKNETLSLNEKSISQTTEKNKKNHMVDNPNLRFLDILEKIREEKISESVKKLLFIAAGMLLLFLWLKLLKKDDASFRSILILDFITTRWQYRGRENGYLPSECIEPKNPKSTELFLLFSAFFLAYKILIKYFIYNDARAAVRYDLLFQLCLFITGLMKYSDSDVFSDMDH